MPACAVPSWPSPRSRRRARRRRRTMDRSRDTGSDPTASGEFITSSTVIGSRRWAYSLRVALSRALAAIIGPMCGGQPVRRDVGAAVRREEAARSGHQRRREGHVRRQRPHRVAFRLLLERDGEDAIVQARGDVRHRRDGGRRADRAGRVHPQHRLQMRAERARQKLLGLHDALEHVGRLADHDGVDVLVLEPGVEQRAVDCLAHQARRC